MRRLFAFDDGIGRDQVRHAAEIAATTDQLPSAMRFAVVVVLVSVERKDPRREHIEIVEADLDPLAREGFECAIGERETILCAACGRRPFKGPIPLYLDRLAVDAQESMSDFVGGDDAQ